MLTSQIALHHQNFSILPAYEETMLFTRHYAVQRRTITCMAHPRLNLCCIVCSPQADTDWHRMRWTWPSSPGRGREEDIWEYWFIDLIMVKKCLYIAHISYLDLQEMTAESYILGVSKKPNVAKNFIISNLEGKVELGFRKTDFEIWPWMWTYENQYVKIKAEVTMIYLWCSGGAYAPQPNLLAPISKINL